MSTLLEVKGLKKYFPLAGGLGRTGSWVKAVDDINFSIEPGKTFALVGESGCGKTTTARMLLRLEQATAGSVHFDGENVLKLRGPKLKRFRKSVQAVFQDPTDSLSPRMRVRSIVTEPLVVNDRLSRSELQRRFDKVMLQVGLDPRMADLYPHEFSGGQRQRIAVARSLTVRPQLIVLDEPVSALDVSIQAQIMNLLKDLQTQLGISYLLIAHNLATVRYMSHHIGVMYLGRIVDQGPAEEVFAKRHHPYTQALFAAALPVHPDLIQEEVELPGEVPSAMNIPSGCRFHPRCTVALPVCSQVEPEPRRVGPDHYVACHLCGERTS